VTLLEGWAAITSEHASGPGASPTALYCTAWRRFSDAGNATASLARGARLGCAVAGGGVSDRRRATLMPAGRDWVARRTMLTECMFARCALFSEIGFPLSIPTGGDSCLASPAEVRGAGTKRPPERTAGTTIGPASTGRPPNLAPPAFSLRGLGYLTDIAVQSCR
jgi:hypothetical protein